MRKARGNEGRVGGPLVSERPSALVPFADVPFTDGGIRFFSDLDFPATRADIHRSAVAHGAPPGILDAIARLPDVVVFPGDLPDLYETKDRTSDPA